MTYPDFPCLPSFYLYLCSLPPPALEASTKSGKTPAAVVIKADKLIKADRAVNVDMAVKVDGAVNVNMAVKVDGAVNEFS